MALLPIQFKLAVFFRAVQATLSLYYWIASTAIINWISSLISLLAFWKKSRINAEDKAVLVTGCDSGFGYQLVKQLDKLGFHVFATVLSTDSNGAKDLKKSCSSRVLCVGMNVTNKIEVENVIQLIERSGIPLWAVVNNAGIARCSFVEWGEDVEEFEKTFQVNVMGVVRVSKMCLPLLRKTHGRIINVASTMGRLSMPSLSAYCMSKFAVRAFSDSLRRELQSTSFGIRVITIEPHYYKTQITRWEDIRRVTDATWKDRTPQKIRAIYGREKWYDNYMDRAGVCIDMISRKETFEVVNAMLDAISATKPRLYYRCCGTFDRLVLWMTERVSEEWQDWLISLQTDLLPQLKLAWYGRESFAFLKREVKEFNEQDEINKNY